MLLTHLIRYLLSICQSVSYLPDLDSLTNNSHVLVATIERFITCNTAIRLEFESSFTTQIEKNEKEKYDVITPLEQEKKKFVECAAAHILLMRKVEDSKQWRKHPVRSMFAILEQYVEDSKIDRSFLDRMVAHNILHAAFVEMSIGKNRGIDNQGHATETFMQ